MTYQHRQTSLSLSLGVGLIFSFARAKHAAAGMVYLEECDIVHRDLALRNLLVGSHGLDKYTVKVSDFGLSRTVKQGFYTKKQAEIPVRWCSPEILERGIYTSKVG